MTRSDRRVPDRPKLAEARDLVRVFRGARQAPLVRDLRRELVKLRRFALAYLDGDEELGTAEAAYFRVCSKQTIAAEIRSGRLPARVVPRPDGRGLGFRYRIRVADLEALVEAEIRDNERATVRLASIESDGGETE
jgi:hypothetical protein